MIELKNLSKSFESKDGLIEAVKDTNIKIEEGEIFGFIGYSGAGKSTLVRCINLLEKPTTGQVFVDDVNLTDLSKKDLRKERKNIGMIFQHFNLLRSLTVFDNVAFNLKGIGLSKEEITNKVRNLLSLVGISDKENAYPSQLSGGQKQRVAIARALANDPKILLCDEATSALDPQTTGQILELLKELNEKLKLTIVVITHELDVIKKICDRVAVMENGSIVEINDVYSLFSNPKTKIAREFVNSTSNKGKIINLLKNKPDLFGLEEKDQVLDLDFIDSNASESVISKVSRDFDLDCSIIFGDVDIIKDKSLGQLIISVKGENEDIRKAKEYLDQVNVKWELIEIWKQ
ncbi:ATP-binding cassette domain-containing protein [uncultured Helcococcus sp.]|uniref:methionine ABC transporter ATP-binding protein n=1 Tax=uncultured Helcococcus sp. TaxID=1072508 RepID=UPI002622944C|nr:ATP-binding cassette domain-containing protein [uncultured Helcococcus sp.]